MTVTVYKSTDASAPSLTGVVGSLVALLDACLVNGYGAKAAAGWSKAFSGTNKAVYRGPVIPSSPTEGLRHYLRVDDTLSGSAYTASVRGYMNMTTVDLGTQSFPGFWPNSFAATLYMRKSITADATARPWTLVASQRAFYLIVAGGQTVFGNSNNNDTSMFFGEFNSAIVGDVGASLIIAQTAISSSSNQDFLGKADTNETMTTSTHIWPARSRTGLGRHVDNYSLGSRKHTAAGSTDVLGSTVYGCPVNDPIRGGLILGPVEIYEVSTDPTRRTIRGVMPGLWAPENVGHPGSLYDTFDGSGYFNGRSFIILPCWNGATQGRMMLETSDTWEWR